VLQSGSEIEKKQTYSIKNSLRNDAQLAAFMDAEACRRAGFEVLTAAVTKSTIF
jgi:hypothetical protein